MVRSGSRVQIPATAPFTNSLKNGIIVAMKRLYRSESDRIIGGVCGGLGEYFNIDPVIFRVIFVILLLPGGLPGFIPYIVLWIIVPTEGKVKKDGKKEH
jgi:phage shock protein C